jgi:hypothetical protein
LKLSIRCNTVGWSGITGTQFEEMHAAAR